MIRKFTGMIRRKFFPTELEKNVKSWFADEGDLQHRLNYNELDSGSVVFDLGGYKGQWTSDIYSKYLCKIYVFEPVDQFYKIISGRFKKNPAIEVFNYGLGPVEKEEIIHVSKDSSSIHRSVGATEKISIKDMRSFLSEHQITKIDLLKINIEGGEYDLLEYIISTGVIDRITNVQVQFHNFIPDAASRMEAIQNQLSVTHNRTFYYRFVWENWKLNNL